MSSRVPCRLNELGYVVERTEGQWRAINTVTLNTDDSAKVETFYKFLQQDDDIKQVFDNLEPEINN